MSIKSAGSMVFILKLLMEELGGYFAKPLRG